MRFLSGKTFALLRNPLLTALPRYSKFADLPPDHGNEWKRARMTLTPTEAGFEEHLELDVDSGFTPSYVIREKTHS